MKAGSLMRGGLAVAVWMLLCCSYAFSVRVQGASVYVNEQLVLTLRGGRNSDRAKVVAASFNKLAEGATLDIQPVDKYTFQIVSDGRVVLTASRGEAKAQGMSPEVLANTWAARLRQALDTPPLGISTDQLKIPEHGTGKVKLTGYRINEAKITTTNAQVVGISRVADSLTFTGKSLGEAIVSAKVGEVVKTVKITVLPVAARFPQTLNVNITGDPASADTVKQAVEGALWTQVKVHESASYTFKMPDLGSLGYEQSQTITVPVHATSQTAFDADGIVTVSIRNMPIGYRAEAELWYCNDPENVEKPGNLFAGRLLQGQAVRMLYHHINGSFGGMILQVEAVNDSDVPAHLLIIPGDSKPDKNPVLAGLVAGDQLLRNWIKFSGEIVTIPAHNTLPIALRRLAPAETMSGLCYLMMIDGPPELVVRTDAATSFDGGPRMAAAMQTSAPWHRVGPAPMPKMAPITLSPHVYPWPFKTEIVDFSVGGRHGFVRLGQKPIPNTSGGMLDGNFGVFYSIEANCENPGTDPAEVEVVFEASAGYSGALFVLNGEVLRTPLLQPKEEALITKFKLNAGEKKKLSMITVPLSGSSYPATVVIRPAGSGAGPKPRDLASGGH